MTARAKSAPALRRQVLRFCTVGGVTTVLDMALFALLTAAAGVPVAAANVASYSCGMATSFALNRNWTFAGTEGIGALQAARFVVTYGVALALSTLLVVVLSRAMPELAAKVLSTPIVFLWSFTMTRAWVFK